MATTNVYAGMLNQKPIRAPQMTAPGILVQKPPGVSQFAYLGPAMYRQSMENRGPDVAKSAWTRMLNSKKGAF